MRHTAVGEQTKRRILAVCVRLFLEQGYHKTTVAQITKLAGVSNSSFQHLFRAKDGVLTELLKFMYDSQFGVARSAVGSDLPKVCVYALETAIQLAIVEMNENLRDIYVEAYTQDEALRYIYEKTAKELYQIFGSYQPQLTQEDFYMMEIGSGGMMRSYMASPCEGEMTLERKVNSFLQLALRAYCVPEAEVQQALAFVGGIDLRQTAGHVMRQLFEALAMHFDFSYSRQIADAKTEREA